MLLLNTNSGAKTLIITASIANSSEAEAEGEKSTPYSFRHRYSAAGHARGLQPKQIADAMGHSLEVHMSSYARFMTRDLADAFDAVNDSSAKDQKVMNRRLKT